MHPQLARALEPVLRDLLIGEVPLPRIEEHDWADQEGVASAVLWSVDGRGSGVSVVLDAPIPEQLAHVADQEHDWTVEELWGTDRTEWPPCPEHRRTHPLVVRGAGGAVEWVCPRTGTAVCRVGELR